MEKGLFFLFVVVMDGKKMMMAAASLPVLGVLFFFCPQNKSSSFLGGRNSTQIPSKGRGGSKKKKKFQISLKNKKFSFWLSSSDTNTCSKREVEHTGSERPGRVSRTFCARHISYMCVCVYEMRELWKKKKKKPALFFRYHPTLTERERKKKAPGKLWTAGGTLSCFCFFCS